MTTSSTFSLGAGTSKDNLVREGRSVTDICLASSLRRHIGRLVPTDQIAVLRKNAPCLETPRVMQRFEQP
jgi:hypothetical protein